MKIKQEIKKRIVVDLDIVTLAFWDKKDEAKLIEKIKGGLFDMITPYIILEHLSKWTYRKLAEEISNFYETYSFQVVAAQNILDKTKEIQIEYSRLLMELVNTGVKEEDVILVIISSIFDVDYLVTFNRKHLKNNEEKINKVLKKNGLRTIRIALPSEL
ncbi:hypothetical protein HYX00_01625 [Candidatus Woesearchaeota archaeon]|nr:hypothetical protein [Candidatus Woesearchaeota archaeon]